MKLAQWVDEVKAIGGVPDTCLDTLAAMRAASTLCWAEIDRKGQSRSDLAQRGIAWTAAFMVSCARHGATDLCTILVPSDQRQEIFRREAARNYGVLAKILGEAAGTPRPTGSSPRARSTESSGCSTSRPFRGCRSASAWWWQCRRHQRSDRWCHRNHR